MAQDRLAVMAVTVLHQPFQVHLLPMPEAVVAGLLPTALLVLAVLVEVLLEPEVIPMLLMQAQTQAVVVAVAVQ